MLRGLLLKPPFGIGEEVNFGELRRGSAGPSQSGCGFESRRKWSIRVGQRWGCVDVLIGAIEVVFKMKGRVFFSAATFGKPGESETFFYPRTVHAFVEMQFLTACFKRQSNNVDRFQIVTITYWDFPKRLSYLFDICFFIAVLCVCSIHVG